MTVRRRPLFWVPCLLLAAACGSSQAQPAATPAPAPGGGPAAGPAAAGAQDSGTAASARPQGQATGPRPYRQVITARARSDDGLFRSHQVGDKHFFEIPDSLLGSDMLLVTRIAGVPEGMGGFLPAGVSTNEQLVRWARQGDRITLRSHSFRAVADDSLPRMVESGQAAPTVAYPLAEFLDDLTRMLWQGPTAAADPNRRALQRGWIERVEFLMNNELPAPANPGFGGGGGRGTPAPHVGRSDIRPLLRAQLVEVRRLAAGVGPSVDRVTRAHMADVVARIDRILDPRG